MILIAIDPGKTGAVALHRTGSNETTVHKCPDDIRGMALLLRTSAYEVNLDPEGVFCMIERVQGGVFGGTRCKRCNRQVSPRPACPCCKQKPPLSGATSQFNFGKGYGAWLGILSAFCFTYEDPLPRQWQKRFNPGLPKDKDTKKQAVWEQVQPMFPDVKVWKYAADAVAMLSLLIADKRPELAKTRADYIKQDQPDKPESKQMELF